MLSENQRVPTGSISAKYTKLFAALFVSSLLLFAAVEASLNYELAKSTSLSNQQSRALAIQTAIESHLKQTEDLLAESAGLPWKTEFLSETDRRLEYERLFRMAPSINALAVVDGSSEELFRLTRHDAAAQMSSAKLSEFFRSVRMRGTYYGDVYLPDGVTPHTLLGLAGREDALQDVTWAELNLHAFAEKISLLPTVPNGAIYVADARDRLVAHTNVAQLLDQSGWRSLPHMGNCRTLAKRKSIRSARGDFERVEADAVGDPTLTLESIDARGFSVWVTCLPIANTDWILYLEEPSSEALGAVRLTLLRTAALLVVGLVAAVLLSWRLGRRLSNPILRLKSGAEAIGKGDLSIRIDVETGDEIQALAAEFNKMADQLQSYTTSLEQKVSEKTAQLELANRHKSEFLANMSHELRTPLNAVIGFSDVLKEQYFGELNPKQQQYVKDINESGQHLLSLINDILDLSKIEAGKMDLELSRFHLPTSLDNALVLVRERATRRQLQLKASIAEDIGDIVADERKVKQILINLLTNAVKFSHPGGWVEVIVTRGTNETMMTVKDMGPGIAKADQAAIFEEFHQLNTDGSAKQEGTGLGLSLARRFTELHGGRIWVESEVGAGAAFTFTLPDRELPADGAAHSGAVA